MGTPKFIQVNIPATTGKKIGSFEFAQGPDTVETQMATLVDSDGAEIAPATQGTLAEIAVSVRLAGALQLGNTFTVGSGAAVMILDENPDRRGFVIQNNGSANVRVGPVGVTATTGMRLLPDAILWASPPFVPTNALWAIAEDDDVETFAQEIV